MIKVRAITLRSRFQPITLRDSGLYRLSLWSFYYCEGNPCTQAQDFIKIYLKHGSNSVLATEIFPLNTTYFEKPWKQETFVFKATTPILKVSNFLQLNDK